MACRPFIVEDVSIEMKDRILDALLNSGAEIEGDNPWRVDLNQGGVKLEAEWLEDTGELKIRVTHKFFAVSCSRVNTKLREEIEKSRSEDDDYLAFNFEEGF